MRTWLRLVGILLVGVGVVAGVFLLVDRYSGQPEPDVEAACDQIASVVDLDRALGNLDLEQVRAAQPHLEELIRVAPPEIEQQATVLQATVDELADAIAAAPSGDTAALNAVWSDHTEDVRAIQESSEAIVVFAEANCGIDLLRGTGTTPGSTPGSTALEDPSTP